MPLQTIRPSRSYIECSKHLRQLHLLIRSGDGDSERAETLRDEMDDLWNRMSPEERIWTGELSADLHLLGVPLTGRVDSPTGVAIRQRLLDSGRIEDWDLFRSILLAEANSVDRFDGLLFRAIYWAALGDLESSLEFLDHLVIRLEEVRSDIRAKQSFLDQDPRAVQFLEVIADFQRLGRAVVQLFETIIEEIRSSRSMIEAMIFQENADWKVVTDGLFRAQERVRTLSELAA